MGTRKNEYSLSEDRTDTESVSYFVPVASPRSDTAAGFRGFPGKRSGSRNNLAASHDFAGELSMLPVGAEMVDTRTTHVTGPDTTGNAPTDAAVAGTDRLGSVGTAIGDAALGDAALNGTALGNATHDGAAPTCAALDGAAPGSSTRGDAATGCATSGAAAPDGAALGGATSSGAPSSGATLGSATPGQASQVAFGASFRDPEVQHLTDELRQCSRDFMAERRDWEERQQIWAEERRLLQEQVQYFKQLSRNSIPTNDTSQNNTTNIPTHNITVTLLNHYDQTQTNTTAKHLYANT